MYVNVLAYLATMFVRVSFVPLPLVKLTGTGQCYQLTVHDGNAGELGSRLRPELHIFRHPQWACCGKLLFLVVYNKFDFLDRFVS